MTKTYKAGEFKGKCLKILDDVVREKEAVYITKRGKRVAELIPPSETRKDLEESLAGSVVFETDLISPIDETWNADT